MQASGFAGLQAKLASQAIHCKWPYVAWLLIVAHLLLVACNSSPTTSSVSSSYLLLVAVSAPCAISDATASSGNSTCRLPASKVADALRSKHKCPLVRASTGNKAC